MAVRGRSGVRGFLGVRSEDESDTVQIDPSKAQCEEGKSRQTRILATSRRRKSPSNARHTLVRIEAARHGLVAAWCPMDPRPRTPCDQGSRPAAVAINLITTRNWRKLAWRL